MVVTVDGDRGSVYRSRHQRRGRRRSYRRRTILVVTIVVVALVAGGLAWFGLRAQPARTHLERAGTIMREMQRQLEGADVAAARAALVALQEETAAARSATDGLDWRLGARLPWVGADLAAVRTVAEVLDDLSHQALPALLDLASGLDLGTFVPKDGRIDLDPLRRAGTGIAAVDAATRRAQERIAAIPSADLVPELRSAVAELAGALDRIRSLTGTAARAATLLPSMLGGDGSRTYLVLFQNLAEIRATGGLPGAFVVVRADQGRLRIVDQGTAAGALMSFPEPVLPLSTEMRALYTDRLGIYPGDVNATPHFPTAAALAREMYRRRTGTTVDGVLATDPVALSYVLRSTGPLRMPTGPALSSETVVRRLLAEAYATMTGPEQDAYFGAAARAVFDALAHGAAEPRAALAALARAAGERRLLVWSAHADEQQTIAGTVLEGSLPDRGGTPPIVGVFLNDGSGAKLGYYLTHSARLEPRGCRPDGRRELTLTVTLGSTAPTSGLPSSVVGLGLAGDPYTVRTVLMVFAPVGGAIVDMALDGATVPSGTGTERHRLVGVLTVDAKPGQQRTIDVRLLSAAGNGSNTPELWVTPGVNPWSLAVASAQVCPTVQ